MRALLRVGVCAGALISPCWALNVSSCTASASGVAFGTYNPASTTALAGTGTVTATCVGIGLAASWTIALDAGINSGGSFSPRKMKSTSTLSYNLYTDAAHTQIWGDGTGGTSLVNYSAVLFVGSVPFPVNVYGLVAAQQDMPPGTYTDTITVTINY